jgi:tRNA pseudouridine55 synthase
VVNKIRYKLKVKKVGHAGTLDPLATGLLIICTGKMTKQIESFMGMEKEYTGTFVLGSTTPSHDLETEVANVSAVDHITEQMIHDTVKHFTGIISQVPPLHSAIKVGGKRSYQMARKGKDLELKPREVEIKEFEITGIKLPEVFFRVVCSKGTYIRSLARDFGDHLKTGAYLSALSRTRIGPYKITDARSLDEFVKSIQ